MTGTEERSSVGTVEQSLALAVDLRDGASGGPPKGSPSVDLADRSESFTRTPSGYYVLTDLPEDVTDVTVVVDGGDAYLSERRTVEFDDEFDRGAPETFELLPSPAYPFGGGATVVRGIVTDPSDVPVAGATVTIQDRDEATRTTDAGEYALWLRSIDSANVTGDHVEVAGQPPAVTAIHPGDETKTASADAEITLGETTRRDLELPE